MNPTWIVFFDWDGTLIDSLDIKVHNAARLFSAEFGLLAWQVEAAYRQHSGIPRRQLFDAICTDCGLAGLSDTAYTALSERFSSLNRLALSNPQTPGLVPASTRPTLAALQAAGYPLYVSSSAETGEIRAIAQALELDGYFAGIFGSRPGFAKGRQHIERALQDLGASLDRAVFVGDEPADIAIGQEAGVRMIAKAGTFPAEFLRERGAKEVIGSLAELVGLLQESGDSESQHNG